MRRRQRPSSGSVGRSVVRGTGAARRALREPARRVGVGSGGAAFLLALLLVVAPARGQLLDLPDLDRGTAVVDPASRRLVTDLRGALDEGRADAPIVASTRAFARRLLEADDPVRLLVGVQLAFAVPSLEARPDALRGVAVPSALEAALAAKGMPDRDGIDAALAALADVLGIDRGTIDLGDAPPVRDPSAPVDAFGGIDEDELLAIVADLPGRAAATLLDEVDAAVALVDWADARGASRRERLRAAARLVRVAERIERGGWLGERRLQDFVDEMEAVARRLAETGDPDAPVDRDGAARLRRLDQAAAALARATALRPSANDRRLLRDVVDAMPFGEDAADGDERGWRLVDGVLVRAERRRALRAARPPAGTPRELLPVLALLQQRGDRIERALLARLPELAADPGRSRDPELYGRLVDQRIVLRDLERIHDRGVQLRRLVDPVPGAAAVGVDGDVARRVAEAIDDALAGLVAPGRRTTSDARLRRLERTATLACPFPGEAALHAGALRVPSGIEVDPEALARGFARLREQWLAAWAALDDDAWRERDVDAGRRRGRGRDGDRGGGMRGDADGDEAGPDDRVLELARTAALVERTATLMRMLDAVARIDADAAIAGRGAWSSVAGRWCLPPQVREQWLRSESRRLAAGLRAIQDGEREALERRLPRGPRSTALRELAASFPPPAGAARPGRGPVATLLARPLPDADDARAAATARAALDLLEAAARSRAGEGREAATWLDRAEAAARAAVGDERD